MKTCPARFVVVDEDGAAIRTFWTMADARNWACCRGDMSIVVLPGVNRRELERQLLDASEPAVF